VIREDKGRVAVMHNQDMEMTRPIASYEQEIRYLKMQLAAKETEIEQKNFEIEECNKVIEKDYKVKNVLMQTIEMQEKKIREMREKYEPFTDR
jgi:chromosome segregation ATPase